MTSSKKYWNKPFLYRLRVAVSILLLLSAACLIFIFGLRAVFSNPDIITIGVVLPYSVFWLIFPYFYIANEHKNTFVYYQFEYEQLAIRFPFFLVKTIPYQTIKEITIRQYTKGQVIEIYYENDIIEVSSDIIDYEEFKEKLQQNCQDINIEFIEE
jgi:hypothetical protein